MNPLVEARVATTARTPRHLALEDRDSRLTWSDLNREVGGLHGALAQAGVQPNTRVGLLADRSAPTTIGVHAILSAGAAVVPLDPSHPPARLTQVIEDAQLSAILVDKRTARRHARTLRDVDFPVVQLTQRAPAVPPAPVAPDAPALILYTSGSTGRPKGVVLSGRAVHAFVAWAVPTLELGPTDRIAHLSPLSFDLCTLELFAPGLVGAATVVIPAGATMFPATLATALSTCTVIYTVPSVWQRLLSTPLSALTVLRCIVYAGEPFAPAALAQLMAALPDRPVHNFFGPTETNVCCAHRLDTPPSGPVPIGTAASSARLYIHPDTEELWVSGPSVMSGYWNRPTPTLVDRPDGRWLRTGDRVRRSDDGLLHALGRLDTMLKHKGFRVQPEEVEGVLLAHPDVTAARVSVDGPELLAEVVSTKPDRDLARHVARALPPYMVPTRFQRVSALPTTARGKLDRRAPASPAPTNPA